MANIDGANCWVGVTNLILIPCKTMEEIQDYLQTLDVDELLLQYGSIREGRDYAQFLTAVNLSID